MSLTNIPIRPNVEDDHSNHHAVLHERVVECKGLLVAGKGVRITSKNGAYFVEADAKGGSNDSGWDWMYPDHKELDTRLPYSKGKVAYISPDNPLVTSPATDLVLGVVTAAQAGTWLALKDVPINTIVGSVVWYNVPQLPTPGAVTGTPLKGDLDVSTQFWARIERASLC